MGTVLGGKNHSEFSLNDLIYYCIFILSLMLYQWSSYRLLISVIFDKLIPNNHLLVEIDKVVDFSFVYE
ncbi:MAG: hypothetical protein PHT02_10345 [Tissierellia bacterium]|nr:hypothetical protein [Tissierellia bacterium]